ncbi:MAG: hypothetical protein EA421_00250 [Gemmatimonadales bacterium]|nr:MAG: hypothetical protein EA421_00250 [Gemmatimonadales bacterium]
MMNASTLHLTASAATAAPHPSTPVGMEAAREAPRFSRVAGSPVWLGGLLLGMALIVPMHPAALEAMEPLR